MTALLSDASTPKISRRHALRLGAGFTASAAFLGLAGCEKPPVTSPKDSAGQRRDVNPNEEYVWLSANANLPMFAAHDHKALRLVGEELGVKTTIAGPDRIDIPGLIAAIEQTAARRPAGMMVVGWDASALVPAINQAIRQGIPVVCVDADVPASRRFSFIGTDWYQLGVRQAEAMVQALQGRTGTVAMIGLIDQAIDIAAFAGFRSVAEPAGLTVLEPLHDKGNQTEAARVTASLLQSYPNLAGVAGFDSESGPGIGLALKESGRAGKVVATCVDAEPQHLGLVHEGIITAAIGQKRELFTYMGVKALYEINHSPLQFTEDDKRAGVVPVPVVYNTGTYTVTKDNVKLFLQGAAAAQA